MISLTTDRLLLRVPSVADVEPLLGMNADPEVMRYIGDGTPGPLDRESTAGIVARARQAWDESGYGMLSVLTRDGGEYAGWVTLTVPRFLPQILPAVEIGWRFRRSFWGRGYATEAARPLLAYGFEKAGLDRVVSIRHPDNDASGRVMEKLGLRFAEEATVPSHGGRVLVDAITREEYAALS
ncbi:GNAT family N-acetyltransferase [Streptacidiphilus pinicola]|uniref:GNAT family N-acetyltransferase n=1 Tax=Streptacidiphilus pinicola TaxID=2219663 RepID=A0A2X0I934_9ACTN|nr:GNAT family N-acetyltransferase [Streptacidiphilus pinicola]RAG81007.1 GNAT family N-acetyltransferase [Streptacidiphilus pinicola]